MGIKGLFPFLQEAAPASIRDTTLEAYAGKALAIDASCWMYQFLSVVRTGATAQNLKNAEGQDTSHLQGFLWRAIKMREAGVQPVFVFDGAPPEQKLAVLHARRQARTAAAKEHEQATATCEDGAIATTDGSSHRQTSPPRSGAMAKPPASTPPRRRKTVPLSTPTPPRTSRHTSTDRPGDAEKVYKAASRSTTVTAEHNETVKVLLRAMGLAVVEAAGEAEATCAQLCCAGRAHASVTEDMDVLVFGSPRQVKNLFDVEGARNCRGGPRHAREVDLAGVLDALRCGMDNFIEMCMLFGCDYLPHLPKVGPKTAQRLLRSEGDLAGVVAAIRAGRGPKGCSVPDEWDWQGAKRLFAAAGDLSELSHLTVAPASPDYEAIRTLLVERHQFSASRVESALGRLRKACSGAGQQRRLHAFFRVSRGYPTQPVQGASGAPGSDSTKRQRSAGLESGGRARGRGPAPPRAQLSEPASKRPRVETSEIGAEGAEWLCTRCTFKNDAM